ncbi:MAG: HlyD family efflux transporter periplasmic adaptor subunit [bacterium]
MPIDTLAGSARSLPSRALAYTKAHTAITGIIIIAVLAAGYWAYSALATNAAPTTYVTANAKVSTIVSSVTGSGQVSATTEAALKPEGSGTVTYVGVKAGQKVGAGTLLLKLDTTSAEKSVRDAGANLASAEISYQQAISSSGNSITSARGSGFDSAATAWSDLPGILSGLDTILHERTATYGGRTNANAYEDLIEENEPAARAAADKAEASYRAAKNLYDKYFSLYQTANRDSSAEDILALLEHTNEATSAANQAAKDTLAFLNLVQSTVDAHNLLTPPAGLAAQITSAAAYAGKAQGDSASSLSALTTLQNATATLSGSGTPLAVRSAELSLTKAKNALQDAKDNLADYYLYAPFAGTVSALDATVGTAAGSPAVTMIGEEKSAVLSLDEVDAAKIKLGQKATLTFDAIDGLMLTGTVSGIDAVGTVSQGVVTYSVTISLDAGDERVKPGMTVSASIITATAPNALSVPSGAIKTMNGASYVQVFDPPLAEANTGSAGTPSPAAPKNVPVETGISDDTSTQILSGLGEGDQVVVRANNGTAKTTATSGATRRAGFGGF